jgi:hypothetical protein
MHKIAYSYGAGITDYGFPRCTGGDVLPFHVSDTSLADIVSAGLSEVLLAVRYSDCQGKLRKTFVAGERSNYPS